jgi:hypothetical protein
VSSLAACHSKLTLDAVKEAWLRPARSYIAGRGSTHVAVDYVWNGGAGTSRKVLEWNLSAVTPDDASIQTLPSPSLTRVCQANNIHKPSYSVTLTQHSRGPANIRRNGKDIALGKGETVELQPGDSILIRVGDHQRTLT